MLRKYFLMPLIGVILGAVSAKADPFYVNFVTINGPGDNAGGTTINGISNTGALVGFSMNANNTVLTNFVRNPNGSFTTLNINNDPLANANGVNANGIVVGATNGQAFVLNGGVLTVLPAVAPGATTSETAFGINDSKVIVGQYTNAITDTVPGFVYQNGKFTSLNPVANAAVTNAQGVNNLGIVDGFYSTDGMHQHGFLYNTSTSQFTLLADPVQPNLFLTQFLGINDNGLAVGYWQDNAGSQHGFVYNINTHSYSFFDDPNAAAVNGVSITQITGIDDADQITGFYVDANGLQHGFEANPTPEPATLGFAGLGLVVGGLVWRRKRR